MSERYFEDFTPGDTFTTGSRTVSEQEITDFARKFDNQWFHTDREAAKESIFGGLVAGGFHTASLVWALVVEEGVFRACSRAGLGVEGLKWRKPMRPGDTLYVRGTVKSARPLATRPDRGVLVTHYELINQDDEVILSMDLVTLLAMRPEAAARDAGHAADQPGGSPA